MWRIRARKPKRGDDGAVAVVFAIMLVVLLAFVGMGVDLASAYAKTQEVQNGADAAALAIAQQCASSSGCVGDTAMAQDLAKSNIRLEAPTVTTAVSYPAPNRVTVIAEGSHQNFFLGIFGQPSFRIREEATAVWGAPLRVTSMLPVILSRCEIGAQIDTELNVTQTILFAKKSDTGCTPTSGNFIPGGFGWLDTDDKPKSTNKCVTTTAVNEWVFSDPGKSSPSACSQSDFEPLVGSTVLIPVFTETNGKGGSNGAYRVDGFVAWKLEGYFFQNKEQYNAKCSPPQQCLTGKFVKFVTLEDALEYGTGTNYGASIVALAD